MNSTSDVMVTSYEIVQGNSALSNLSGALTDEFVVRVLRDGVFSEFLRTQDRGRVRYFTTRSAARKAITRERRQSYHA
jgi:hypothetical protein